MGRDEVAEKLMNSAQLLDVDYDDSYYSNKQRMVCGANQLSSALQCAEETDDIGRSDTRVMERMEHYVQKRIEGEEKMSEIENVVQVITMGFAWKIENPSKFDGFASDAEWCADEIGIQVRSKTV